MPLFVALAPTIRTPHWILLEKDTTVPLARATDCSASLHTSPAVMSIAFRKED